MSDEEIGQLEFKDFYSRDEFMEETWTGSFGVMYMKNSDPDNPFTLPDRIKVSSNLVLTDHNLFDVNDYGLITFHRGVINGWAKYRLDEYDPRGAAFTCQLRDGEIVHPSVALRHMKGILSDE